MVSDRVADLFGPHSIPDCLTFNLSSDRLTEHAKSHGIADHFADHFGPDDVTHCVTDHFGSNDLPYSFADRLSPDRLSDRAPDHVGSDHPAYIGSDHLVADRLPDRLPDRLEPDCLPGQISYSLGCDKHANHPTHELDPDNNSNKRSSNPFSECRSDSVADDMAEHVTEHRFVLATRMLRGLQWSYCI